MPKLPEDEPWPQMSGGVPIVRMGVARVTLLPLPVETADHGPPIFTRMYQNCWTPVTPRVASGRSFMWIEVPPALIVNGVEVPVAVTGTGPAIALPDSKKPTSVTLARLVPVMSMGCSVPVAVPAG